MHITVVGAGPAGLYFAYLMKRSHPVYTIRIVEQNAPDATFGFGVVLSGRALGFLAEGDAAAIERISRRMERWSDQHIVHRGTRVIVDGNSYAAVERIVLLQELQALCRSAGVVLEFGRRIDDAAIDESCDVLVGADGANSVIRDRHAEAFGTRIADLQNYYAWYGAARTFPAHTLTFRSASGGVFCAHHYRYAQSMSTFVAETDAETWEHTGMGAMHDDERRRLTERVFADTLGGTPLVSNRSIWRRWRLARNERWHFRNMVLIGDALRSAHPSIGSGTRLAMEDAISLWRAVTAAGTDIGAAFARYERERRPIRDKLNRAAELSIAWYETMAAKMSLAPYDFALDYLLRTGLLTIHRLRSESPEFLERYERISSLARANA